MLCLKYTYSYASYHQNRKDPGGGAEGVMESSIEQYSSSYYCSSQNIYMAMAKNATPGLGMTAPLDMNAL